MFRLTRQGIKAKKLGGHIKYQNWLDKKDNLDINNVFWTRIIAIGTCATVITLIAIELIKKYC